MAEGQQHEACRPRKADVWTATVISVLGAVGAASVLFAVLNDGSDVFYHIARLGLLIPVLVVTVLSALLVLGVRRFQVTGGGLLAGAALSGAIGSLFVPFAALGGRAWGSMIPLEGVVGLDFRQGLYEPAAIFSTKNSIWPPLNLILGKPFTLLSEDTAYWVQVVVLVVLALAVVAVSADLGRRASGAAVSLGKVLAVVFGLWLFTSYGLLFEVERGNVDLYALFFSLMGVWLLVRSPKAFWLPTLCLAVATCLKLYPGVLLVLVFWRHRWRAVAATVVLVAGLLLIAGPQNVWQFVENNLQMQRDPAMWLGNHSAASFAYCLHESVSWIPEASQYVFLAVPALIWAFTLVVLVKQGWSQRSAIMVAAASVPLMNIVPPVSHDYKLVLLVLPLAVLGALLSQPATGHLGLRAWRGSLLFLTGLSMVLVSVSTLFWAGSGGYPQTGIGNKYPLVLLVQILVLTVALLLRQQRDAAPGQVAA